METKEELDNNLQTETTEGLETTENIEEYKDLFVQEGNDVEECINMLEFCKCKKCTTMLKTLLETLKIEEEDPDVRITN